MPINRLLTDEDRKALEPTIDLMFKLVPQTMARKIPRANVQQAFILNYILHLIKSIEDPKILSVGCYDDTAYEYLRKKSVDIVGIDPQINFDLSSYRNSKYPNKEFCYDIIFSTSVLEHVEDDEDFIRDMCVLLKPYGYGILTVDFNNNYVYGDRLPATDLRFYTKRKLEWLRGIVEMFGCEMVDEPNWEGEPEFTHDGCKYSFATFVFRKNSDV